jgi:hypothetical protein
MEPQHNQALSLITKTICQYRDGQIDVGGLQQNLAAAMTALEGDIPHEIRDTIYDAEAAIELLRFTVDPAEQAKALERVFNDIDQAF